MTAQEHLAQFGVSMEVAAEFIFANLETPEVILAVSDQFDVTNDMLGQIVGQALGTIITGQTVIDWFAERGLDSSILEPEPEGTAQFLTADLSALSGLIGLNLNTGILSTASLKAQVLASVDLADYNELMNPERFQGTGDGVLTGEELGVPGMPNLDATAAVLESIFFGSLINVMRAVDAAEYQALNNFINSNFLGLENGSEAVLSQYSALMIDIFKDPAAAFFSNQQMAQFAAIAGVNMVLLIGLGEAPNLFEMFNSYPCFM
jgi:hypothetical protein